MNQENNNTELRKNKHLNYKERYTLNAVILSTM